MSDAEDLDFEEAPPRAEDIPLRPVYLTLKQFSILVGLSRNTVLDRLEKGLIRGAKSGRLWRIPVTEIGRILG